MSLQRFKVMNRTGGQGRCGPTRSHPEHGRETQLHLQYCRVYLGGTIGRCQCGSLLFQYVKAARRSQHSISWKHLAAFSISDISE
jgi:hypothetical protein